MSNNITRVCPFIRPISVQGGTFYTFNSAAEDLTLSFNENADRKFKFSKFALLNLPNIENEPLKNTIKLNAIAGAYNSVNFDRTTDWNNHFAESFQNYCLNLETAVISKDSYNSASYKTVSERVFFKWLKEISAIRFTKTTLPGTNTVRYNEEIDSDYYNRVIQYIGNIDFVNNYSGQSNSYSEIYFHLPTEVGNFPNVYFNTNEDSNYYAGMALCRYNDGLDNEYVYGRHYNDTQPAGLDFHAFYDNPWGLGNQSQNGPVMYKQKIGKTNKEMTLCDEYGNCDIDYDINTWWYYPTSDTNCYYTEPLSFTNATNENYAIVQKDAVNINLAATKFIRSKLDGIEIDFDESNYKTNDSSITYLIDVARSSNSKDFEFNAILVYYDLYSGSIENDITSLDDNTSLSTPYTLYASNLFGVLFLDNVENNLSLGGGYIPRFKKCKPNSTVNLNGNAYGFKLNLKLDVTTINSGVEVETIISDSNTLSMDIYADALNEMKKSIESVQDLVFDNIKIDARINTLENYLLSNNYISLGDLQSKIQTLEDSILQDSTKELMRQGADLLSLITLNTNQIENIISGTIPTKLSIDMDMIKAGEGIIVDKSSGKDAIISVTNRNFNLGDIITTSVKNDWSVDEYKYYYEVPLRASMNYLRLEEPVSWIPNKDLAIYIADNNVRWSRGQIFRIYLKQPYKMNQLGSYDLILYTGKNLAKWKGIGRITSDDFSQHNYRPVIELICTDESNLEFIIDYIN